MHTSNHLTHNLLNVASKFQVQVRLWSWLDEVWLPPCQKLFPDIFVMENAKWQDWGLKNAGVPCCCNVQFIAKCYKYIYREHWLLGCTGGKDWITAAALLSTDHPTWWQQPPIGQICTSIKIWSNLYTNLANLGDNLTIWPNCCTDLAKSVKTWLMALQILSSIKNKERPNFYWKILKRFCWERQRIRDQGRNAL